MTRLDINKRFAEYIEIERTGKHLTQKQMADRLMISLASYKRLLTGETNKIDLYMLYRLYLITGNHSSDQTMSIIVKILSLTNSQLNCIESLLDMIMKQ